MDQKQPLGSYLPQAPRHDEGLRRLVGCAGAVLLSLLLLQSLAQLPLAMFGRYAHFFGDWGSVLLRLGSIFAYFAATLVAILLGLSLFGGNLRLFCPLARVRRDYFWPALWMGLGVAMVGNLAAMAVTGLLDSVAVYSIQSAPDFTGGAFGVAVTLLGSTLLPAVMEELLFRGVLLQPLRRYGDRLAVVISTLLFALCHSTLPQFVNALVVGAVLAVFAVRTGSLRLPMVLHLVYNSIACAITFASGYLSPVQGVMVSWTALLALLLAGLVGGLVLRRRFGPVWWVSQQGPPKAVVQRSVLGSVPLWTVVLACTAMLLRSLYFG